MFKLAKAPRFYFTIGTQSAQFMRKFYKKATVQRLPHPDHERHLYGVMLDGRVVKTPMRNKLAVPNYEMAFIISHEFNMQEEYLKPATMPILSLSRTTIDMDLSSDIRDSIENSVNQFVRSDTVLFREQGRLGRIQNEKLNPVIDYVNKLIGIDLKPTEALVSRELTEAEKSNVLKFIQAQDNWTLMAMEQATINTKSTCIGISLIQDFLSIQQAVELSRIEETFQIKLFGLVEGSHDLEENTTQLNLATAKLFSRLAKL